MKVLVVGASGAIGSRLVPQLLEHGHEVVGTCRSPDKAAQLRALVAEAVVLDALDAKAVHETVAGIGPEAIIHQATALADVRVGRNFDRTFAQTNRLRTEGTDNLLAAARKLGVRRFVAQSFASMRNVREGGMVKTEDDPLDPDPPATMREGHAAMRHVEEAVTEAGGIALRYGGFYGAANDALIEPVRKRRFPIVGDGAATPPGSTSTTPRRRPCSHSTMWGRRSTTSPMTSPHRSANGCRCWRTPSAPSHPATFRCG
jgi:nucleoside-diphosphate-sugar epimerase